MNRDTHKSKNKKDLPPPPLKPKHPLTKGAPDDNDPEAQYEDKDES